MTIGIFSNVLLFEKAGIGQYGRNLVKNLAKIDSKNNYILYFSFIRKRKKREKEIAAIFGKKIPKNFQIKIFPFPAAWIDYFFTTRISIKKLIEDDLDIYFSPYVNGIPKNGFSKMIFMCHDLVFVRFPQHRGSKLSNYYLKRHITAAKVSKKIIVPSFSTRKDLRQFLNISHKKIRVIQEAVDRRFRKIQNIKKVDQVVGKYLNSKEKCILSVATLEPRKNLIKLIEAYCLLPNSLKNQYKLVLVGGKGWNNEKLIKTIYDLNLKERVIMAGFVKDEDLAYIYNKASLFVYPSLYEGFGLPPLEALSCGVPVIVSNASSLPEVIGRAGILFDPSNEKELARAIEKILTRKDLQESLSLKGLKQAKRFSWARAAEDTLKLFWEVKNSK